jgi:TRAP-type C4-dicarboxylate transport system permease large subunit
MDYLGIIILITSFIIFLALGVPIAFSIGLSGILTMLVNIDTLPAFTTFAHRMATGLDSFALLAIPFFILAGNIMNRGGIAIRLINFARVLVGRLPGGLAFVNILANMLFGAISGSAAASASAIGTIMSPEMKKEGYDKNFSAAVNITSATTGLTIPPSNVLIVYSLASGGASIAALFVAGYIPGILTGVSLMLIAAVFAIRKKYAISKEHMLLDIGITFGMLFSILGLIYVFSNDQFNWTYLLMYAIWLKTILIMVYPKFPKAKWFDLILGFGGVALFFVLNNSFPVFLIPLLILALTPLLLGNKKVVHSIIQTLIIAIAINIYSDVHFITSAILLLTVFAFTSIIGQADDDLNHYFKGTRKFFDSVPSLLLLVVVIGGIIAGIFTATEASAVAVLYAAILAFIYNEIKISDLPTILLNSVRTTSIVLLLVAASIGLSWIMSFENIPQNVSSGLLSISNNPIVILLIINLILLFVGVFMDMTPAVLIFTPIFLPIVVTQLGLDPIHFGIIMVLNLSVGLCTPPVGSVLFIGCSVSGVPIARVIKPLFPMFIAMIITLLLVTYIPALSLWLPNLFGF